MEFDKASGPLQFIDKATWQHLYRQLTVFGMLGAMRGLTDDANLVFAAAERKVTEPELYRVAVVMAHAMNGDPSQAIESMQARLTANPDDDMAKVVMGTAMLLTGHPDGQFTLDNTLATSLDQPSRQAALAILEMLPQLRMRAKRRADSQRVRPA